jgi:Ice-binding-like
MVSSNKPRTGVRRLRLRATWATALLPLFGAGMLLMLVSGASAAVTAVPLGTSASFAVLAGSGITNTGPTTVNGDLGTFPTTTVDGSASITVNGANHGGDAVTQGAKNDLVTAYNTAAGEGPTSPIVSDLGGQTLTPGVYNSASSIGLTGDLTLNAGGDPNAVFVFQAGSSLITASTSRVNLVNGAQSCNIFWQVGSSATLGTGSTFRGTVMALTSITVTTAVTIDGRVLARNGAVTLDTDTITRPACTTATATTTTTTTAATTTTATTPTTTTPTGGPAASKAATAKKVAAAKKAAAVKKAAAAKKVAAAKKAVLAKKAAAKKTAAPKRGITTQVGSARPPIRQIGLTG